MKSTASAVWEGDLKSGKGRMSARSDAFKDAAYSFKTRFEGETGATPEEMIAAAHAGCFSMAFANELAGAGLTPERVETEAEVMLEAGDGGPGITRSALTTRARVPGGDEAKVREIAEAAKKGCPVSKALNAEITLDLTVEP
ncbi:MAG: OsmC family protein [Pseudomonadota bacterium]